MYSDTKKSLTIPTLSYLIYSKNGTTNNHLAVPLPKCGTAVAVPRVPVAPPVGTAFNFNFDVIVRQKL